MMMTFGLFYLLFKSRTAVYKSTFQVYSSVNYYNAGGIEISTRTYPSLFTTTSAVVAAVLLVPASRITRAPYVASVSVNPAPPTIKVRCVKFRGNDVT